MRVAWGTPRLLLVAVVLAALLAATPGAEAAPKVVHPAQPSVPIAWQAGLVLTGSKVPFCGGTLREDPLDPTQIRYVVTAAHCLFPGYGPGTIQVLAGLFDRAADVEGTDFQRVEVDLAVQYPGFHPEAQQNDAALLRLAAPVAEIPGQIEGLPVVPEGVAETAGVLGAGALVSGWGYDAAGGTQPNQLAHGFVDVLPHGSCGNYAAAGLTYDPASMLCAGRLEGTNTVDTCLGDSGGPLARQTPDPGDGALVADWLVGITSFGIGCANPSYPGVYTNLTNPAINAWVRRRVGEPPVATRAPAVEGSGFVGQPQTCTTGWDNADAVEIQWFGRAPGGGTVPLGGGPTFTPGLAERNQMVGCSVHATNPWGSASAVSPDRRITVAPRRGGAFPRTRLVRRSCFGGRCRIVVRVLDADGLAGMDVRAALRRVTGCRTRPQQRRRGDCRVRTLVGRPRARSRFVFRTPKLRRGRYRLAIVATDGEGRRQRRATVVRLTIRR